METQWDGSSFVDETPRYFIWRNPSKDPSDVTGLNFFPPVGSDELDQALKCHFPQSKTAQERRLDATIQFLQEEKLLLSLAESVPQNHQPTTSYCNEGHGLSTGDRISVPEPNPATRVTAATNPFEWLEDFMDEQPFPTATRPRSDQASWSNYMTMQAPSLLAPSLDNLPHT